MTIPSSPEQFPLPESADRREQDRPYELRGDELMQVLQVEVPEKCNAARLDSTAGDRTIEYVKNLIDGVTVGEPIVIFSSSLGLREGFRVGGMVAAPPCGVRTMYGDWDVCIPVLQNNREGERIEKPIVFALSNLLYDHASDQGAAVVIAGEYAVREKLSEVADNFIYDFPTKRIIKEQSHFFEKFRSSGLDIDYFGMTDENRYQLANNLLELTMKVDYAFELEEVLASLTYVAEISEPHQMDALYDVLQDQWAALLQINTREYDTRVRRIVEGVAHIREAEVDMTNLQHVSTSVRAEILHYDLIGALYERRAVQEHAPDPLFEDTTLPELHVATLPQYKKLTIFEPSPPTASVVYDEITYLRELQAAGYTAEFALERSEENMRCAVRALAEYARTANDNVERLESLAALEFIFGLKRDEQRDELYDLLCNRFAITIPAFDNSDMSGHIGIAEAIGRLMPYPPKAEDGTVYQGRARTAAILARMYKYRAKQLTQRALKRYRPTEANEES